MPVHAASASYRLGRYVAEPELLSDVVEFDRHDSATWRASTSCTSSATWATTRCRSPASAHTSPARLQCRRAGRCRRASRRRAGRTSTTSRPTCTTPSTCSGAGDSISCTPASAHCAGCRAWSAGPRSLPGCCKPGGQLFIREGHPVLWALDDPRPDGLAVLAFPYFETDGVQFSEADTYVDQAAPWRRPTSCTSTTASPRSSTPCGGPGWTSRVFEEHRRCRGIRWATRCTTSEVASTS